MVLPLSLVVSTLGRSSEIARLLESLESQTFKAFELIIVDQNADERISDILSVSSCSFPVTRLHRPQMRGLSRGRNAGWPQAQGEILLFPDDDCWYPPGFLAKGMELAASTGADFISGRAADETGRDINGRYGTTAHEVSRANVWTSGIEWVTFVRRSCLERIGGYDEDIGIGASTPWQSAEGQAMMLRALAQGLRGHYDPALIGHHAELNVAAPNEAMIRKGRSYARGMGYVLRISGYPLWSSAYWSARPLARAGMALARGNLTQFRYYFGVSIGRVEGYLKYTL